ncbi:hypothetical protein [Algirhabdus cladophorae]|uniref:hypothetical protein n=1 Tax=Algirhabdus cladophorae TaxID=3377108 RepID=UPI003B847416
MDERVWTDRPLAKGATIEHDGASLRMMEIPAAYLISGDLDAALNQFCSGVPCIGLLEDGPEQGPYAIRIGRHNVLLIADRQLDHPLGWDTRGFGVSDAKDVYVMFTLTGERANDILAEGGVMVPHDPCPSAATQFAGIEALITRQGRQVRIAIPRAMQTYVTSFLTHAL